MTGADMKQTPQRKRVRARGMTLVEVVVAMGVLAVGMTGLAASLMAAMASADLSKSRMIALQDGGALLEVLQQIEQRGAPGTVDTLLDVATNVNLGLQNPGGGITLPIGAQEHRTNQAFRVDVVLPPNRGQALAFAPVVAAALPNATRDEYEIIVTVSWLQGARPSRLTIRTVRNIF